MDYALLRLNEKHEDTLTGQTTKKPHGTIEFKLNPQMKTFFFSPPTNLSEKRKWLLTVTIFEITNSVFSITDENKYTKSLELRICQKHY